MVGENHRLNGHAFEQTLGDSEGQGRLVSCSPWSHKEPDTTWQLNNTAKEYGNSLYIGIHLLFKLYSLLLSSSTSVLNVCQVYIYFNR